MKKQLTVTEQVELNNHEQSGPFTAIVAFGIPIGGKSSAIITECDYDWVKEDYDQTGTELIDNMIDATRCDVGNVEQHHPRDVLPGEIYSVTGYYGRSVDSCDFYAVEWRKVK